MPAKYFCRAHSNSSFRDAQTRMAAFHIGQADEIIGRKSGIPLGKRESKCRAAIDQRGLPEAYGATP